MAPYMTRSRSRSQIINATPICTSTPKRSRPSRPSRRENRGENTAAVRSTTSHGSFSLCKIMMRVYQLLTYLISAVLVIGGWILVQQFFLCKFLP
uniref:Uncharacterized protein n=1 Tax=Echinococcus granulosus TaxID=6210 RepID=A0A068WUI6_ECHGR|nr:hypothetical protein EgrG_000718500 [Echinococcus granulosus]